MAMKIYVLQFSPNNLPQTRNFPNQAFIPSRRYKVPNISCIKKDLSDSSLALDLSITVEKINNKDRAVKRSKELLFTEFCKCVSMKEEELNKNWRKMKEEEKWVLVHKFVDEWGADFHPLSVRSVKAMVDEYLQDDKSFWAMLPSFKKVFGFSQDT